MKVTIRRGRSGLEVYVPKQDLEALVVETQLETLWGGWIRLTNGLRLQLPALAVDTPLPVTVEARRVGAEEI